MTDSNATELLREELAASGIIYGKVDMMTTQFTTWEHDDSKFIFRETKKTTELQVAPASHEQAVAAMLGDTRHERTCRDTGESRLFRCSECGFGIEDAYLADEGAYGLELDFVRFCPNCGKAVKR